jgi:hypothetical protein
LGHPTHQVYRQAHAHGHGNAPSPPLTNSPAHQAAAADGTPPPDDPAAKKDPDQFYSTCNARKWGQRKKIPLSSNTEFCCAHWAFDKRKSQCVCAGARLAARCRNQPTPALPAVGAL